THVRKRTSCGQRRTSWHNNPLRVSVIGFSTVRRGFQKIVSSAEPVIPSIRIRLGIESSQVVQSVHVPFRIREVDRQPVRLVQDQSFGTSVSTECAESSEILAGEPY